MSEANGSRCSFSKADIQKADVEDVNKLLSQLSRSSDQLTEQQLAEIIGRSNFYLLVARYKNRIVGMATLTFKSTLMRNIGFIDDVVVDENHRRQGIAGKLLDKLIKFARTKKLSYLDLTSNPQRKEANKLYLKLGFKLIGIVDGSNYYRLIL